MSQAEVSYRENERMLDCRSYILNALIQTMDKRSHSDSWIEDERLTVACSASEWAQAHGYAQRVTVDDVERIETSAVGHIDYAAKLALYVAEFVVYAKEIS